MADQARERIDALVNRGLLDQWYAVAKSVQVKPGKPHAVKALGRNLVLWRDAARRAQVPGRLLPASRRAALARRGHRRQHRLPLSRRDARRQPAPSCACRPCPIARSKGAAGRELPGRRSERRDLRLFRQRPRMPSRCRWTCRRSSPARNGRRSCACRRGPAITATRSTISPIRCTAATCTPTRSRWRSGPSRT